MSHDAVRAALGSYLEGELGLGQRALIDAHLDVCAPCADELRQLRATVALLRGLPEPPAATNLAEAVMARLRAGEGMPRTSDRVRARLADLARPRVLAPLAAAFGGILALASLQPDRLVPRSADLAIDAREEVTQRSLMKEDPTLGIARTAETSADVAMRTASELRLDQGLVGASVPTEESAPPVAEGRVSAEARDSGGPAISESVDPDLVAALEDPEGFVARIFALEPAERARRIEAAALEAARRGVSGAAERALLASRDPRGAELAAGFRRAATPSPTH